MSITVHKLGSTEKIFVAGLGRPGPQGPPGSGGGGGSTYAAGEGIVITTSESGEEISVKVPVKPLTRAEYDALPDAEKQKEILYLITDETGGGGGGEASSGVSSFNGRSGEVNPQDGDYTAEMVNFTSENTGLTAKNVQGAIEELFTSVSEGKALIASAITDKGVETAADASFQTMQENILAIESGGGLPEDVYTIHVTADPPEGGTVTGGGVASKGMTVSLEAQASGSYVFSDWRENGETVSPDNIYTFPVNIGRTLVANFSFYKYVAGLNWWGASLPSAGPCYSVTHGAGKFLAIWNGSNHAAWSENGKDWIHSTLPDSLGWYSATYGNGKFVVVADKSNQCAWSKDCITWSLSTLPISCSLPRVTFGNGIFVAVSSGGDKAIYSSDGETWEESSLPNSSMWRRVAYGDGKFVAVGLSKNAALSEDGKNWVSVVLPYNASWTNLVYGSGKFVALSTTSEYFAICSNDGKTWRSTEFPIKESFAGLAYGNGKFVSVGFGGVRGSNKAAYSPDGENWEIAILPSSQNWMDIAYGDGRFVAVALENSKAAYSYTGNEAPT